MLARGILAFVWARAAGKTPIMAASLILPRLGSRMRIFNFSPGPAVLPEPVLRIAAAEMLDWHGTGMCVMEMSHRGKEFISIADKAEADLARCLRFRKATKSCSCKAAPSARTRSCR